jgi:hypothetical protein
MEKLFRISILLLTTRNDGWVYDYDAGGKGHVIHESMIEHGNDA